MSRRGTSDYGELLVTFLRSAGRKTLRVEFTGIGFTVFLAGAEVSSARMALSLTPA